MDMTNVKYAFVQNAHYKVKCQSVLFLPTHGGISGWFGLGIWLNTKMVQQNLNSRTVTHPSTNRARCRVTYIYIDREQCATIVPNHQGPDLGETYIWMSFYRVINYTIFFTCLFVASRNSASWLVSCVCLYVCDCVCVFLCFLQYSRQVTIKERSSPGRHQSGEELIRLLWGQRSKSCSNDYTEISLDL